MELCNLDGELEILINYADEPTIALRGEVDFRNMDRVRQAIVSLVERDKSLINIDLRGLIFMDSTGVSALIDAANSLVPKGCNLRLIAAGGQLSKVLSRCGMSGLFQYEQVSALQPSISSPSRPEIRDVVEFEVPSQPQMLSYIRARAGDFACSMPFGDEDIEDIKLAIGEAATNAIRHGTCRDCHKVRIRFERGKDEMRVFVIDRGRGFDPDSVCPTPFGDMCEGGRGIMFMRALMDDVTFSSENPGTCVEMTKKFQPS
ncbi:MAG: ATP-binding protein [Armatimonadota bacterium]